MIFTLLSLFKATAAEEHNFTVHAEWHSRRNECTHTQPHTPSCFCKTEKRAYFSFINYCSKNRHEKWINRKERIPQQVFSDLSKLCLGYSGFWLIKRCWLIIYNSSSASSAAENHRFTYRKWVFLTLERLQDSFPVYSFVNFSREKKSSWWWNNCFLLLWCKC